MSFSANLFLIGAQKAGTTYLASLLGQHPDICLAEPKEPDYFSANQGRGKDWYRSCFEHPEARWLLDASTSYSAAPLGDDVADTPMAGVAARIRDAVSDARFIYLLRDPVKRAYSSYWHAVRGGYEQRPFAEVIRHDDYYLRMGCYDRQLEEYLSHFDRERFQLLFFEDFIKAPEDTANQCVTLLGLTPVESFRLDRGTNETYTYGPLLQRVNRAMSDHGGIQRVIDMAKKCVPHGLLRAMRGSLTQGIPPMDAADRVWLAEYYAPHNAALAERLGPLPPGWTTVETAAA